MTTPDPDDHFPNTGLQPIANSDEKAGMTTPDPDDHIPNNGLQLIANSDEKDGKTNPDQMITFQTMGCRPLLKVTKKWDDNPRPG